MTQQVRVFVSSPSDTQFERMRVDRVVERLNGEFAGVAQLSTIRWELEFYKADSTFQQQIPQAADCDIVIAILRHRLGTALSDDFARMPNGEPYPSGTAYEILTAIDAGRKRGLPDVYVFRYPESPTVRLDDRVTNALVSEQWDRLKTFFQTWFQTPSGHFTAAFQQFRTTDEFEAQVDSLLRKWLADRILKDRPVTWPIATKGSPFRGLAAFGVEHAPVFFGRSRDITLSIDALKDAGERGTPFLLVVGPSGSGKSSLAQAGLVPRLTTPGVVPTVDIWRVAVMRPGAHSGEPLASLAQSLFQGETDPAAEAHGHTLALPEIRDSDSLTPKDFAHLLAHADDTSVTPILRALDRAGEAERQNSGYERPVRADLLLVVDQLDELFGGDILQERRQGFSRLLAMLAASHRVWIIATLRADLYERLLADTDLRELKGRGAAYDLAPPGTVELAEIVRRPAEAAGLVYDKDSASGERLDDRLLADAERPDMLPLLQFTLDQLFDQRETVNNETRLTFAAYSRLGGLSGAVDQQAERAVLALGRDELERLPRLVRQLAAPAEGLDSGRGAARLTARSVPMSHAVYDDPSSRLVRALVDARILLSSGGDDGEATIRLAHQRVLESWKRAQAIVAANADFYRIRNEVEDQHRRWDASGRQRDLLIPPGLPLVEAETIRARYADELPRPIAEYIDASSRRGQARHRLQQFAVAAFGLLALIAVTAGIWALWQQRAAKGSLRESRASTSRFLADLARQRLDEGRVGEAVALARQAVPLEIKGWPRVPTAENALALAMQSYSSATMRPIVGYVGHEGAVRGVEFSPDSSRLLTWSYDATARLWDVKTGVQLRVLGHDDGVRGARFSSDGRRALTWSFDGTVRLWNLETSDNPTILRHDDIVNGAVFSKDETRILSWSHDDTARVWDSKDGRPIAVLRHKSVVMEARFFNSDLRILTRAFDDPVGIWNASDGTSVAQLKHEKAANGAILFSHETRVLTWSDDKSARVWNAQSGAELLRLSHDLPVRGAGESEGDARVVTWSGKVARLWDSVSGKEVARFEHEGQVNGAALSASGDRLLTWSDDKAAQVWEVATRKLLVRMSHADAVIGARFSPDGAHAVSWSYDGTAKVSTFRPGQPPTSSVLPHQGTVRSAAFNTDSTGVWTRSDDGTARLWSDYGHQVAVLRHSAEVLGFLSLPAGNFMATFSADGSARLWDLAPTDRFAVLRHDQKVMSATFSNDGQTLLTSSNDHTAILWDVQSAKQRLILHHAGANVGGSFSPDGGAILTWSEDGTVRVSDARTGVQLAEFKGPTLVRHALYSHNRLLAWFTDGTMRLWNVKSGAVLAEHNGCGDQMEGLFSADGRYVLIRCSEGTLQTLDSAGAEIGRMVHQHAQGAVFSPDGTRVMSWSPQGTVRIWDIHGKKMAADISHAGGVSGALFSQHGERVLTWGGGNAARMWDPSTGGELNTLTHTKRVGGAAFSDDGNRVWTWSDDGSARLWEAATGKELRRLQHGDAIAEAMLLAGGHMLATRSVSTTAGWNLCLWDVQTGEALASLTVSPQTRIAEDGRYLATWSDDTSVLLWPLWAPTTTLVDQASRITERLRPLSLLAKCQAHLVDAVACDQFPATTERLLAEIGEDKHLRLNALHASTAGEEAPNVEELSDNDIRVELVVNDRSEAFIFHNKRFRKTLKRLEFNRSTLRLVFRFNDGSARDFGLSVDARLGRYFDYTERVLTVLIDEKTGEPIEGNYFPLLLY